MDEILSTLQSPVWWFSAVLVALLVNLISAYLRDAVDRGLKYAKKKLYLPGDVDCAKSNTAFLISLQKNEGMRRFLFEAETRARLLSIQLLLLSLCEAALYFYSLSVESMLSRRLMQPLLQASCILVTYYAMERYSFAYGIEKLLLRVERERKRV